MKIVHVCPFVGEQMGGSERYVYNLSKAQSKNHNVHIYTTTSHLDRAGTTKHNGVTIHRFYTPTIVWNINPLVLMLRALTKSDADVFHIHSYLYTTSNQAVFAKILKKRKSLLHIHGGVGIPPYKISRLKLIAKRFYDKSLGKFTIRNSDLLASVSCSDLEILAKEYSIPQSRMCYIPNLVDTETFKPRKKDIPDKKTLLYLGDLEPWKGIGSLIKWVRNDHWNGSDFKLRLVGQGSYLSNLLALQKSGIGFNNGISLDVHGPRNHTEIPSILNEASALVLPSYWEGMPTVILEAMASGIPVISTNVGDVPNVIKHRKTGFLIDRSFHSFREAVNSVLDDIPLVQSIAKNARNLVKRDYSISKVERTTNKVYHAIIS